MLRTGSWSVAWETVLDAVFPPRCLGCGRSGSHFCDRCVHALDPVPGPWCRNCGGTVLRGDLCPECARAPGGLQGVRSAGLLRGPLRRAVHRLKYRGRREAAAGLAALLEAPLADLVRSLGVSATFTHQPVLVPVPLHPERERQRGYNQATLLAQPLARAAGLACTPILVRTRHTTPQVGLSRAERRANLRGAFRVTEATPEVAGRLAILVDDVTTTGSTLAAAAEALRAAGLGGVCAVTLAREA